MDTSQALSAFGALSQETRLDVVRILLKAGDDGMLAGQLGDTLGVRQNTMSSNLSVLLNAGLVRNVREGRAVRYYADLDGMRNLLDFLMRDCCQGRPELCQPVLDALECT